MIPVCRSEIQSTHIPPIMGVFIKDAFDDVKCKGGMVTITMPPVSECFDFSEICDCIRMSPKIKLFTLHIIQFSV